METGHVSVGDRVLVCPTREMATVKSLSMEDTPKPMVFAGDQASVTLAGIEMQNVAIGYILCDPLVPVPIASKFQTRIVIFNVTVPITKGFPVSISLVECSGRAATAEMATSVTQNIKPTLQIFGLDWIYQFLCTKLTPKGVSKLVQQL